GGRAGRAVGQEDRGGPGGPVDLDVQPGAGGGDGGQLPDRDGRGVGPGGDVRRPAHAVTSAVSSEAPAGVAGEPAEEARSTAYSARSTRRASRRSALVEPGQEDASHQHA